MISNFSFNLLCGKYTPLRFRITNKSCQANSATNMREKPMANVVHLKEYKDHLSLKRDLLNLLAVLIR